FAEFVPGGPGAVPGSPGNAPRSPARPGSRRPVRGRPGRGQRVGRFGVTEFGRGAVLGLAPGLTAGCRMAGGVTPGVGCGRGPYRFGAGGRVGFGWVTGGRGGRWTPPGRSGCGWMRWGGGLCG